MNDLKTLKETYQQYIDQPLNLNIARGIPSKKQLDLSSGLLNVDLTNDFVSEDPMDIRNYGGLFGIKEARKLMAEVLETTVEQTLVGGNSSLQLMYLALDHLVFHQDEPWSNDKNRKFLCPVPGYDRHWDMLAHFGFELIPIPLTGQGPDMKVVKELVANDASIKGIFCVPKYSNPTGEIYSNDIIRELAEMETLSPDFKIFWDNAYVLHHLTKEQVEIANLLELASEAGNADRPLMFASTSKMTMPGSGIAAIGSSEKNLIALSQSLSKQTIGFDKVNQKRQVKFLKNKDHMLDHMAKHGEILKPKFDYIIEVLTKNFSDQKLVEWTEPKGGYFIHLTTKNHCASKIVTMLKDIGVILTPANAAYPGGVNEKDNSIRLAPSFASLVDLGQAMEAIVICIKIVTLEQMKKENE